MGLLTEVFGRVLREKNDRKAGGSNLNGKAVNLGLLQESF